VFQVAGNASFQQFEARTVYVSSWTAMAGSTATWNPNSFVQFNGASVKSSSSVTSGFSLWIDGAYTTAQLQAKNPGKAGVLVFNSTLLNICVSTGATVQGYKLVGTASTTCQ
jgi:hypothetical protein